MAFTGGVTVFLLHKGRWWIISGVTVRHLTTATFLLSAADEDDQTSNADGKENEEEYKNSPAGSLHTERLEREGLKEIPARGPSITTGSIQGTHLCTFSRVVPTDFG